MATARGVAFPWGFSARELFQWIGRSVRPVPEMLGSVKLLKDSGERIEVGGGGEGNCSEAETAQKPLVLIVRSRSMAGMKVDFETESN